MRVIDTPIEAERGAVRAWLELLRLHHWSKNLLVLAPLLAAHGLGDATRLLDGLWALLAFGFCASAVYAINDRVDRVSDRAHPDKRGRPLSDGRIAPAAATRVALLLFALGLGLAALRFPLSALAWLVAYVGLALVYSFALKRLAVVDLLALVGFYLLRIAFGGAATGVPLSAWLLGFALCLFASLALLKRHAELVQLAGRGDGRLPGRGYGVSSLAWMQRSGRFAALGSAVVLATYSQSETARALYAEPLAFVAAAALLLAWQLRAWRLADAGRMHHDPLVFALRDRLTWLGLILASGLFWWALRG